MGVSGNILSPSPSPCVCAHGRGSCVPTSDLYKLEYSMAGVTTGNVGYLANAIHEVTKSG